MNFKEHTNKDYTISCAMILAEFLVQEAIKKRLEEMKKQKKETKR